MYVRDVKPDRWQRSVRFLRVLAESLQWRDDRIALALFAHIAAPQVRLTRDPNTFFFFLDHLQRESPFPLREDTTWDTNIELGIHWGARLVEKDEELLGRSPNGKAFVLVSDGQAWSGEIAKSLQLARSLDIPVHVVGVGTSYGGLIPQAPLEAGQTTQPRRAIDAARSCRFSTAPRCSRLPPRATASTSTSNVTATARSPPRLSRRRDDGPARARSRRASKSCIGIACWPRPGCSAFRCCCCASAPSSGSSWSERARPSRRCGASCGTDGGSGLGAWVLGLGARTRLRWTRIPARSTPAPQHLKHLQPSTESQGLPSMLQSSLALSLTCRSLRRRRS